MGEYEPQCNEFESYLGVALLQIELGFIVFYKEKCIEILCVFVYCLSSGFVYLRLLMFVKSQSILCFVP